MNHVAVTGIVSKARRISSAMCVLLLLNLSIGAPFLCYLHCAFLADEMAMGELSPPQDGRDAHSFAITATGPPISDAACLFWEEEEIGQLSAALLQGANQPSFDCAIGDHESKTVITSFDAEFADLYSNFVIRARDTHTLQPETQATPFPLYLPPIEKPPSIFLT